jgi:hypothetical protein
VAELGFDDVAADSAEMDDAGVAVWEEFWELVVGVVASLHASGQIAAIIGHEVPVLINGADFYEETRLELSRAANPARFHAAVDRWSFDTWAQGGGPDALGENSETGPAPG